MADILGCLTAASEALFEASKVTAEEIESLDDKQLEAFNTMIRYLHDDLDFLDQRVIEVRDNLRVQRMTRRYRG